MSTLTLFALFAAFTFVSLLVMLVAVRLAIGSLGWRVAFAVTGRYTLWALALTAAAFGLVWVSQDLDAGVRTAARGLAGLLISVGPLVVMQQALRDRAQMPGVRGWSAALAVTVGAGAVAIGLALVIRMYVLEAFIVPTGAMAPTIIGQHQHAACTHCGFAFDFAPRDSAYTPSGQMLPIPNKTPIDLTCPNCGLPFPLPPNTPIREGDRILADKTTPPKRWDAIIYRNPEGPGVNFVHRLVGLPGERITIRDGEVYADGKLLQKPPDTHDDLWFPVHDTAHAPHPDTAPSAGWRSSTETGDGPFVAFPLTLGGNGNPASIRFAGRITTALPYNAPFVEHHTSHQVGNLRLQIEFEQRRTSGSIAIHWGWGSETIDAEVGSARGRFDYNDPNAHAGGSVGDGQRVDLPFGSSAELTIRDGRSELRSNGVSLLRPVPIRGSQFDNNPPTLESHPIPSVAPPRLTLSSIDGTLAISRIRVWRDVYYTELGRHTDVTLGPDEFFVLGDNSDQSKDSRIIGPIPRANLIGVARWRYWPPSRWHAFAPPAAP